MRKQIALPNKRGLSLPGVFTAVSWQLPANLTAKQWVNCGRVLDKIESGAAWWRGDWWNAGEPYGDRVEAIKKSETSHGRWRNCGVIAAEFEVSRRRDTLEFYHHELVAAMPRREQDKWLDRAEREEWSANQLKAAISRQAAIDKTIEADLDAEKLGKFVVLYADPPWQYEFPPMGGSNRSIENQYPTMTIEELAALADKVDAISHIDSVMFMWATNPKLAESKDLMVGPWGFPYKTNMVWVKDDIGMGYYVREQHELLLIGKRGNLPPPAPEARPPSMTNAPRLEHSAKPPVFYDLIDRMYPNVRKIELFGRGAVGRPLWSTWGNQAHLVKAAAE